MKMSAICALLVLSALAASSLANVAPVATCNILSFKTFKKLELLDDGSVTASGPGSESAIDLVFVQLPNRHIQIMRYDTSTFLVYNNGSFTHGTPEDNNHVFMVEYIFGGQAITLKAVNHKYTPEAGSGSGMGEDEKMEKIMEMVEMGESEDSDDVEMIVDCYLGVTDDGTPKCYSSKYSENEIPLFNVLFNSHCFN